MPTKKEKTKSKPDAKPKAKEWNVVWKDPNELTPYEKNARKNDATVPYLVNSIKRFGFRVPLVIDAKAVVVCGHTRLKAALNIGMKKVPCVVADDLTKAEVKAFRLADNKIAELSGWDFEALDLELEELKIDFDGDMIDFGFGENSDETERDNDKKVKENFEIIVECMDERDMQEKYEDLLGRGYTCRISTL
jgi:site-specific DNA-methyltransferase (adenine-specific)